MNVLKEARKTWRPQLVASYPYANHQAIEKSAALYAHHFPASLDRWEREVAGVFATYLTSAELQRMEEMIGRKPRSLFDLRIGVTVILFEREMAEARAEAFQRLEKREDQAVHDMRELLRYSQ